MGSTAMESTDWFGVGKVVQSFFNAADRPSINVRHLIKKKKSETEFNFNISKLDAIFMFIIVTALYIAAKRHMQGYSSSESFLGGMQGMWYPGKLVGTSLGGIDVTGGSRGTFEELGEATGLPVPHGARAGLKVADWWF